MNEREDFMDVDGLSVSSLFDPALVRHAMNYKLKKGDILVASYPKCGTMWTMMTVVLLRRRGEPVKSAKEWFRIQLLLESSTEEQLDSVSDHLCIHTHLPFYKMNYSQDGKYIYVIRNPADCMVSYYHYMKYAPYHDFSNFDEVFDLFLEGKLDYGDFFDHLLSGYELRNLPNVLFLTFESMKKDPKSAVLKIAKFLDESLVSELLSDDESMLKKVLHHSSFEIMQTTITGFYNEAFTTPPSKESDEDVSVKCMNKFFMIMEAAKKRGFKSTGNFVRRGKIGDGKLTLSEKQKEKLNTRILEKTSHSDVMDIWKDA